MDNDDVRQLPHQQLFDKMKIDGCFGCPQKHWSTVESYIKHLDERDHWPKESRTRATHKPKKRYADEQADAPLQRKIVKVVAANGVVEKRRALVPFATDFMKQLAKSIYKVSLNYIDGGLCNDSRKYPPKIQVLKFKMMPDLFERFFGNGGDFVDGEVVRVRANWRPLTDLDDVFAYGDSWRKHTGPRHRFVLTRMLVQHTEAGYATFKFAGGLRVYGRNEEGDNEFTALIAPGTSKDDDD